MELQNHKFCIKKKRPLVPFLLFLKIQLAKMTFTQALQKFKLVKKITWEL